MKTNRELNTAHDNKEVIRPKTKEYQWQALAEVIKAWQTK